MKSAHQVPARRARLRVIAFETGPVQIVGMLTGRAAPARELMRHCIVGSGKTRGLRVRLHRRRRHARPRILAGFDVRHPATSANVRRLLRQVPRTIQATPMRCRARRAVQSPVRAAAESSSLAWNGLLEALRRLAIHRAKPRDDAGRAAEIGMARQEHSRRGRSSSN